MIKPIAGYLLIEQIEEGNQTSSGLVMPSSAKDEPSKGKVLWTGADTKDEKCPVVKGAVVIFERYGGQMIREDGKELRLVKFNEIMAVVK